MDTNDLYPDPVFGIVVRGQTWTGSDSEMEVVTVAPDHDYSVIPETGERASVLTEENEALRLQIRELQH